MITNLLLNIVVLVFGAIFSWLPAVESLPTINGFDIDSALVTGVAQMRSFFTAFWAIGYVFGGFLVLMGYYVIKMVVKFFLGHRSPTS